MVNPKKQSLPESDVPYRRRGRPAGKNRIPLSREERRARNAQYERERRTETAEVMSQLIEAANCDPNISNAELLATVINRIQRANINKSEDITELERINANLEAQIATLQGRLALDDAALELLDSEETNLESVEPHSNAEIVTSTNNCNSDNSNLRKQRKKRKRSERLTFESVQQGKRPKTQSESCSVDSGIEMRGHTVSPPAVCVQDQNNTQYMITTEQLQLPEEITEEQDHHVSQAYMELQTELYNQIYKADSQSSVESRTEFVASLSAQSQSIPSKETLSRSLIVVPSIIPPQQVRPDNQEDAQSEMTVGDLQNVELPCDFDIENECDFLQQNDNQLPTVDFLTDMEKGLLSEWIGADFLETSEFCDNPQMQVRSCPIDDMLSGYS